MHAAADDDERHGALHLPIAPAWHDDAACVDMDTEAFHDSSPEALAAAKAVCADCPAIARCRDLAVADSSLVGVWGGQIEKERRTVARRQGAHHLVLMGRGDFAQLSPARTGRTFVRRPSPRCEGRWWPSGLICRVNSIHQEHVAKDPKEPR